MSMNQNKLGRLYVKRDSINTLEALNAWRDLNVSNPLLFSIHPYVEEIMVEINVNHHEVFKGIESYIVNTSTFSKTLLVMQRYYSSIHQHDMCKCIDDKGKTFEIPESFLNVYYSLFESGKVSE